MKTMKKIATLLLCVCLTVPCFSMMAFAVDGKVTFNDPTAAVGEEFTVTVTVAVDAGVSNLDFTMSYDPAVIEFISAPNATKTSDGIIEYSYELNQNSLLRGYDIAFTFKALQEGTTKVDIASYDIGSFFDISWVLGYSNITIGNGTSTEPTTPDEPTGDEPTADEPTIDEPTTDEPASDEDTSSGNGAQIVISNTTTITLFEDVSEISLPERYLETTVTMKGVPYPVWQDTENPELYIVYAMSTNGTKSLYQYDTVDNTYQRFIVPVENNEIPEAEEGNAILALLGDNFKYVAIGAGALVLLLFVIVIILSVKLYNRNAELDEVYDDLDEALAEKVALKKEMMNAVVETPVADVSAVLEETEDDVILTAEEAEEEEDPEVEVEFYVAESVKEFFEEEEETVEVEAENVVEETVTDEVITEEVPEGPVVETTEEVMPEEVEVKETEELEEDYFEDLDADFMVDFIDLDD